MLTILCWFWRQPGGRTDYTASHVNTWAAMVRRNIDMPHRLACVTDVPAGIDSAIEIIRPPGDFMDVHLPSWTNGRPQCLRRLSMFRPDAARLFGHRFVSMDIDCVIGGKLDPLFRREEDLILFKGSRPQQPYNGSMMLITAGCRPKVFTEFTHAGAIKAGQQFVGSDQAWLSYKLGPDERKWDERDGVWRYGAQYQTRPASTPEPRILFYPGKIKPWTAGQDAYTRKHYRLVPKAETPVRVTQPTISYSPKP